MKTFRKELWFNVPSRRAFINITPDVQQCIDKKEIKEGLVLVNAMHITASVFINDDEPGLHHDYDQWLEKLAPHEPVSQYRHNVGEDNADAHPDLYDTLHNHRFGHACPQLIKNMLTLDL
ncbi:MAG: YjbQ family protein [Desulfotignum sp.]|nr:YjbQ family protein [Desulfotignum sp.]